MLNYSTKIIVKQIRKLIGSVPGAAQGLVQGLVLALLLSCTALLPVVNATEAGASDQKRKSYTLSQRVGKKMIKVYDLYAADKLSSAIKMALTIKAKKPYDKAYLNRFLGNMYAGQSGQSKKAINYLKRAVAADILSTVEHGAALRTLADLQMQQRHYKSAIKRYRQWLKFSHKTDPQVWVRIAQAHLELKQYAQVIKPANRAIALFAKPNKNPYLLKLSAYFERKQYRNTIKVAEKLVALFPQQKNYWLQLSQFYMANEQYKKALSTMHLAYLKGFVTSASEIKLLAQLYRHNNIPHRSAVLLDKHIKSGLISRNERMLNTVARSWHQAKELDRAIDYYGQAAAIANNGELHYKQGMLAFELENYRLAITSLKRAIASRKLRQRSNAVMTLAQAYFYVENYTLAYKKMQLAAGSGNARVVKNAKLWLKHIKATALSNRVAYR